MSVLVKGMEKPEHCGYCRFRYDGICHALQRTQYSMDECPLIDEDVIKARSSAQPERQTEVEDILQYLDEYLHPIVSPENWNVYSELYDMISCLPSARPDWNEMVVICDCCGHAIHVKRQ